MSGRELADAEAVPDWEPFFAASGLDPAAFRPTPPARPSRTVDSVAAWVGGYPGQRGPGVEIAGAARAGRVVRWEVTERADPPTDEAAPRALTSGERGSTSVARLVGLGTFAALWLVAALLARRHLSTGRGDRRGAWRLGLAVVGVSMVSWVFGGHYVAAPLTQLSLFFAALAESLLFGVTFWLYYLAIEPIARRLWPRQLTSWTRLLSGRWDDPLVARDLVAGIACFSVWACALRLQALWQLDHGGAPLSWVFPHGLVPLGGARAAIANDFSIMIPLVAFSLFLIFVCVRAVVRHPLASVAVTAGLLYLFNGPINGWGPAESLPALGAVVAMWRFGLLGMVGFAFAAVSYAVIPTTLDPSVWWSTPSAVNWLPPVLLTLVGYRFMRRPHTEA